METSFSSKINLTPNSLKVLEKRYLKKNEDGKVIETAEELFRRIAKTIASADMKYGKSEADVVLLEEEFYSIITSLDFLPNSPTLMNAGGGSASSPHALCCRLMILWSRSSMRSKIRRLYTNREGEQGSVFQI